MPPACKGEPGLGFSDQREKEQVPQRWQTADGWVALCLGVPTASQDAYDRGPRWGSTGSVAGGLTQPPHSWASGVSH